MKNLKVVTLSIMSVYGHKYAVVGDTGTVIRAFIHRDDALDYIDYMRRFKK